MFHQLHNLPGNCAKGLFKPSVDSASLRVGNENIFGFWIFCE